MSTVPGKKVVMETQTMLKSLGFDPKGIDGAWGKNSQAAFDALVDSNSNSRSPFGVTIIPWGNKLTLPELEKMAVVVKNLGWTKPQLLDLMACIAWESGESFSPAKKNPVSSATGLIQIMEAVAKEMGTTTAALAKMTVVQYLDYVEKYFWRYRTRVKTLSDLYMAILWPAAIGRAESAVLWSKDTNAPTYKANSGLDLNQDGTVTVGECVHKIRNKYVRGFTGSFGRRVV